MVDKTLRGILSRIERRLKSTGLSAQAASKEAGLSKDAIRNIKRAAEDKKSSRSGAMTTSARR